MRKRPKSIRSVSIEFRSVWREADGLLVDKPTVSLPPVAEPDAHHLLVDVELRGDPEQRVGRRLRIDQVVLLELHAELAVDRRATLPLALPVRTRQVDQLGDSIRVRATPIRLSALAAPGGHRSRRRRRCELTSESARIVCAGCSTLSGWYKCNDSTLAVHLLDEASLLQLYHVREPCFEQRLQAHHIVER